MDKIAELAAADWQPKGGGFELVRSREKMRVEEQREFNDEVAMYQKAIDDRKKKAAAMQPFDEKNAQAVAVAINETQKAETQGERFDYTQWQRLQALDEKAPGGRGLTRLIATLQAKDIAALPDDYKTVFSDQPTSLQRALPASAIGAIKDIVAEQSMWADVASRILPENMEGAYSSSAGNRVPFNGKLGKVLLMVSKEKNSGFINVNIEFVATDQKGAVVVRTSQSLNSYPEMEGFKEPKPEPNEKPLEPNGFSKALRDSFMRGEQKTLPKEVLEQVLNPEKFEPLSLSTGDLMVKIGDVTNTNVIAALPDEAFAYGAFYGAEKVTPSMIVKAFEMMFKVTKPEGWLIMNSKAPATSRASRADRSVVGNFLRAVSRQGRPTLEDLATYALSVKGELYNSLGYMLSTAVLGRTQTDYFEADVLRMYGLMDSTQRQILKKGGKLLLTSLNPGQTQAVNRMIFGRNSALQPLGGENDSESFSEIDFYGGIGNEPTELFGKGVPRNASVSLSESSQRVVVAPPHAATEGISFGSQAMTTDDIAQRMYAKERPGIFPWMEGDQSWDPSKLYSGSKRTLSFTFEFGTLAQMQKELADTDYSKSTMLSYDQLPEDFRKEVQTKLAQMRENYKDMKPGQFGGTRGTTGPPPPRR